MPPVGMSKRSPVTKPPQMTCSTFVPRKLRDRAKLFSASVAKRPPLMKDSTNGFSGIHVIGEPTVLKPKKLSPASVVQVA